MRSSATPVRQFLSLRPSIQLPSCTNCMWERYDDSDVGRGAGKEKV